jgi:hypothetical protein
MDLYPEEQSSMDKTVLRRLRAIILTVARKKINAYIFIRIMRKEVHSHASVYGFR